MRDPNFEIIIPKIAADLAAVLGMVNELSALTRSEDWDVLPVEKRKLVRELISIYSLVSLANETVTCVRKEFFEQKNKQTK